MIRYAPIHSCCFFLWWGNGFCGKEREEMPGKVAVL